MSEKDDHLEALHGLTHLKANKDCVGCLARHQDYKDKAWPDCNYRKKAHEYSIANDSDVYNVPSLRSPERWLKHTLGYLEPVSYASSHKTKAGQVRKPTPLSQRGCWDLQHTISDTSYNKSGSANFHHEDMPYFHNTHHIFACDEVYRAFTFDELQILVTAKYNINREPNVIILPKQKCVAWALKLPAHCPDKCAHDDYSERVRTKLANIKGEFQENAEDEGHEVTDGNAPNLVDELEKSSKELRDYLIEKGYSNPGIDLDHVDLP